MKRIFSLFFFTLSICSFSAEAQYLKINTIAGTGGIGGYGGDGLVATAGVLNGPHNVAVSAAGEVYIVDYFNFRVRKIKTGGSIVTFAGNGLTGYSGDGTAATNARMNPQGVAVDFRNYVYITDNEHHCIRRVNPTTNIVTTFAGTGVAGYDALITVAKNTRLNSPHGITCDAKGNVYFADAGNHMIRKIDTFGVISDVAGDGTAGFGGDGFGALTARLDSPYSVAIDRNNNIYIADHGNNRIRVVDVAGNINTYAGNGIIAYLGDAGLAVNAEFNYPTGVAVDTAGNVYISDSYNNVIREVDAVTGIINTIAGNSWPGFGGDLGGPLGANLFHPYGLAVDVYGSIYIADANNQRVRKVYYPTLGVEDLDPNGVGAYPNPFENNITIAGVRLNDKICLYDLVGRPVTAQWTVTTDGEQTLEVGNLAKGMYLLQVTNATGSVKSVVKMVR